MNILENKLIVFLEGVEFIYELIVNLGGLGLFLEIYVSLVRRLGLCNKYFVYCKELNNWRKKLRFFLVGVMFI